jgi:hypothetical protein
MRLKWRRGQKIALIKVEHRLVVEGLHQTVSRFDLVREIRYLSHVIAVEEMRRLGMREVVDRLEDREPSTGLEDPIELIESLLLVSYVDQDGARRHNVHGSVFQGTQVFGRGAQKTTPIHHIHLPGEVLGVVQKVLRNVAEDDPALLTEQVEGAEGDQAVSRAHVEQDLAVLYVSTAEYPLPYWDQEVEEVFAPLWITAVPTFQ